MRLAEDDRSSWAENEALRQEVDELREAVQRLEAALKAERDRIEELEGKKGAPARWVKVNKPKKTGEKKLRRKRAASLNGARRREEPTRVMAGL